MHLATVLELAVHRYPDAVALLADGRNLTYAAWDSRINSVARGLADAGVRSGDRVALCTTNSEASATLFFAIQKLNAIAVPLSTRWKAQEIAFAMADADVRAILFDQVTRDSVNDALSHTQHRTLPISSGCAYGLPPSSVRFDDLLTFPADAPAGPPRHANELATILYTSGTIGPPKGVPRTHWNDYTGILSMILAHGWTQFERTVAVMPFFHVMGLHTLIAMVILNGTCAVEPKFDPDRIMKLVKQGYLTALYLVPTAFHDLVVRGEAIGRECRPVPKLAYAGAPMSAPLARRCQELFQPDIFVNHYGCTEMQIITANRAVHKKTGSAGRPTLNTRVRIVVADRSRIVDPKEEVAFGTPGEIIVDASTPQAFAGYLNRPEATASAIRAGWYFTGDLGFFDRDGDLTVIGRVDDMIVSGGENIHPAEIEEILSRHPSVAEVAVLGLPDDRWGQIVTAFVVPSATGIDVEALDAFCLHHTELARFKRPRRYVTVAAIPKSPSGKVLRSYLRAGTYAPHEERPPSVN